MAFNIDGFERATSAANTNNLNIWAYESTTDNIETISEDDYFLSALEADYPIMSKEILMVKAADGAALFQFDTVNSTTVTVAAFSPSTQVCKSASFATASSNTPTNSYVFTIPGITSDDIIVWSWSIVPNYAPSTEFFVTATNVATPSDGFVTLYFNTNVTAGCIINYAVFKDTVH